MAVIPTPASCVYGWYAYRMYIVEPIVKCIVHNAELGFQLRYEARILTYR